MLFSMCKDQKMPQKKICHWTHICAFPNNNNENNNLKFMILSNWELVVWIKILFIFWDRFIYC